MYHKLPLSKNEVLPAVIEAMSLPLEVLHAGTDRTSFSNDVILTE